MMRSLLGRMPFALKAALPLLLVAGVLQQAQALIVSWNADDLRGVWVLTCTSTTEERGEFYVQFSCGGEARTNNTQLEILGGGTYGEENTRSVTGGLVTIATGTGTVTIPVANAMTLVNQNANTSTITLTAGTMGNDKNTISGVSGTDTVNGTFTGTATKISDQEVRDGNSAGQACFLSASRR